MHSSSRVVVVGLAFFLGIPLSAQSADITPEQIDAIIAAGATAAQTQNADGTYRLSDDAAELQYTLVHSEVSDAQWQRVLNESDIITLQTRAVVGTTLAIWAGCPAWTGFGGAIKVTPRLPAGLNMEAFWLRPRTTGGCPFSRDSIDLGVFPSGDHIVEFDVEVRMQAEPSRVHPRAGAIFTKQIVHKGTITKTISIVTPDVIQPVTTPDLEKAIRQSLYVRLNRDAEDALVLFGARAIKSDDRIPDNVALNVVVEIIDPAGQALEYARLDLRKGLIHTGSGKGHNRLTEDQTAEWKVRIRGDPERALREAKFDTYWDGELTIPFNEAEANE